MKSNTALFASAIAALFIATQAQAQSGLAPAGFFVEGGVGDNSTAAVTAGVAWPWSWRRSFIGGEISGVTEAYISEWSAPNVGGRRNFTQVGLVPMFRLRPAEGQSPWFAEAGIGLSMTDRLFTTDQKQFSTRFNFVDIIGVGFSLGADRKQEIGLRVQHVSNAGIKHPNPGQNFLQLRYGWMF
jgi:lipid A 3-O-deacylase